MPFNVRAHGQFSVRVDNSKKLLLKIVGTTNSFTQKILSDQFRGLLLSRIKDYISNQMVQDGKSFLEINSFLTDISEKIKYKVSETFLNYGLKIEEFFVESINIEHDEIYDEVRKSMARRAQRKMEGMDKITEESFEVAKIQAGNQGTSGNIAGIGIGAAVGMGVGQTMGGFMGKAMQPAANAINLISQSSPASEENKNFGVLNPQKEKADNQNIQCKKCGEAILLTNNFCPHCGASANEKNACPQCGSIIGQTARFCDQCGANLSEGK